MMELSFFDACGIFIFVAIAFLIYKRSWFYSFYSFIKFLVLTLLAFFASIFITKNITLALPLTQFQTLIVIQAIIFVVLWRIVNFEKIFFALDRRVLNIHRFFFVHRLDKLTSIIPAAVASAFISFFFVTTVVSASTSYPDLQKQIEDSKIVKPILYEIYFANLYNIDLFEGIAYNIVPESGNETSEEAFGGIDVKQIGQDVIDSFREKINAERGSRGLGPIVYDPPTNLTPAPSNRGGAGTFTPPTSTPTPTPTITPINRPLFQIFPSPTPLPTATPLPTQIPSNSGGNYFIPTPTAAPYVPPPANTPFVRPPTTTPHIPPPTATPFIRQPIAPPPVDATAAEQDILRLTNEARAENGLSPLRLDGDISAVARAHSRDMVARNFFSHTNPDGLSPFDRMQAGGISYTAAAENIARGANPEMIVQSWMNSPGHRKNILNPVYSRIGIGVVQDGKYGIMATQNFAN